MTSTVVKLDVSLDQINTFIKEKLAPAIDGTPFVLVNATFLAMLLDQQGPEDMTAEELAAGVSGASWWITTYLSTLRGEVVVN